MMPVFLLLFACHLFIPLFSLGWDTPLPPGQSWRDLGWILERGCFGGPPLRHHRFPTVLLKPIFLQSLGWFPTKDTVGLEKLVSAGSEIGTTNLFQLSHSVQETRWEKAAFGRQGNSEISSAIWWGKGYEQGASRMSITYNLLFLLFVQWEIFPLCVCVCCCCFF